MRSRSFIISLLVAASVGWLASCGGMTSEAGFSAGRGSLAAPVLLGLGSLKATSSAPGGIYISWTRSAEPSASGYYVYRDTSPIALPPPDETLPAALRRNSGSLVPQPPSGTHVTFNDMGPLVVGQTYYYRVTVYDGFAESYPSNEMSWQVHGHTATTIDPDSAFWGDVVTINGDTFGTYDPLTDAVHFPKTGGGEVTALPEQPGDWTDTGITVTVPELADSGLVSVIIDGIIAQTDEPLTILNPRIFALNPAAGFREQTLEIQGAQFGATQGSSTVSLGGVDVSAAVVSWGETSIELTVPADSLGGAVQVVSGGIASNTLEFTVLPEILAATPVAAEAGEPVTLAGRLFGAVEGQVLLDGVTALAVDAWGETEISFTLAGGPGAHTLVAVDENGLASNAFNYEIEEPLAVELTGLDSGTVYRFDEAPVAVGVVVPVDADKVELLNGAMVIAQSTTAPFSDITLPVTALTSGTHELSLRAYRRAVTADSAPVSVMVYSLVGDLDGDGLVGQSDADLLPAVLGLSTGVEGFLPWLDPDDDGAVTEADLALIGFGWGNMLP